MDYNLDPAKSYQCWRDYQARRKHGISLIVCILHDFENIRVVKTRQTWNDGRPESAANTNAYR